MRGSRRRTAHLLHRCDHFRRVGDHVIVQLAVHTGFDHVNLHAETLGSPPRLEALLGHPCLPEFLHRRPVRAFEDDLGFGGTTGGLDRVSHGCLLRKVFCESCVSYRAPRPSGRGGLPRDGGRAPATLPGRGTAPAGASRAAAACPAAWKQIRLPAGCPDAATPRTGGSPRGLRGRPRVARPCAALRQSAAASDRPASERYLVSLSCIYIIAYLMRCQAQSRFSLRFEVQPTSRLSADSRFFIDSLVGPA